MTIIYAVKPSPNLNNLQNETKSKILLIKGGWRQTVEQLVQGIGVFGRSLVLAVGCWALALAGAHGRGLLAFRGAAGCGGDDIVRSGRQGFLGGTFTTAWGWGLVLKLTKVPKEAKK